MDLIEFFNSDELELPGSWDTYPGSFDQYIAEMFDNYQNNLRAIAGTDYLSKRVCKESAVAYSLCVELKKCFDEYLKGQPSRAYATLTQVLKQINPCFKAMYSKSDVSDSIEYLYRIRQETRPNLSQKELFHVPFTLRHLVATYRYSIPGLPKAILPYSFAHTVMNSINKIASPSEKPFSFVRTRPFSSVSWRHH